MPFYIFLPPKESSFFFQVIRPSVSAHEWSHAFSLLALDVSTLSLHIGSESESKEKKTGIFFFSSTSCQRRSQTQKSQKCSFHSTATVSRRVCCAVTPSSASQLSSPHTHTHTHILHQQHHRWLRTGLFGAGSGAAQQLLAGAESKELDGRTASSGRCCPSPRQLLTGQRGPTGPGRACSIVPIDKALPGGSSAQRHKQRRRR